ncbi:Ig-like domain-containing protein, partial [Conexibacter sp. CPCC 205706]
AGAAAATAAAASLAAGAAPAAAAQRVPANCQTEGAAGITCTGAYGQSVTLSRYEGLADGDTISVTVRDFAEGMRSPVAGFSPGGLTSYFGGPAPKTFDEDETAAAATAAGVTFPLTLDTRFGDPLRRQLYVNVGDRGASERPQQPRTGTSASYDNVLVPVYATGQPDHGDADRQIDTIYLSLAHPASTAPNGNYATTAGFAPGETVSYALKDPAGQEATVRDLARAPTTFGALPYDPADSFSANQGFYVPSQPGRYTLTATGQRSGIERVTTLDVLDPGVTADASARTVTDPRTGVRITVSKTRDLDPAGERLFVTYTDNPTNRFGVQLPQLPVHALAPSLHDGFWAASDLLPADVNEIYDVNFEGSYVVEVSATVPEGRFFAGTERYGELGTVDAIGTQSYLAFTPARIPDLLIPLSFAGSGLPEPTDDQRRIFANVTPGPLFAGDEVKLSSWYFNTALGEQIGFTTDVPGLTIAAKSLGVAAYGEGGRLLEQTFRLPATTPPGTYTVTATGVTSRLSLPFAVTVAERPVDPPVDPPVAPPLTPTAPIAPPAPPATPAAVPVTTTTRLSLSAQRSRYGAARSVTVAVRRADGMPASGPVTVKVDGRAVATRALDAAGRTRVALPRDLRAGARAVTASFAGGGAVAGSEGGARLRIAKASARVVATVSPATRTRPATVTVRVAIVGAPASLRPAGRIVVRAGGRRVANATLTAARGGTSTIRLPGIRDGRRLTVAYGGDANVAASTAVVR